MNRLGLRLGDAATVVVDRLRLQTRIETCLKTMTMMMSISMGMSRWMIYPLVRPNTKSRHLPISTRDMGIQPTPLVVVVPDEHRLSSVTEPRTRTVFTPWALPSRTTRMRAQQTRIPISIRPSMSIRYPKATAAAALVQAWTRPRVQTKKTTCTRGLPSNSIGKKKKASSFLVMYELY